MPGAAAAARRERTARATTPRESVMPARGSSTTSTDPTGRGGRARGFGARGRTFHGIKLALDSYRKQKARQLKWKSYMVFQRQVIAAIDAQRPTTLAELAKIPGLGPAKLARFGDDILALVRKHAGQ
jgi:superfamily II DNA helicase RecQ